MLKSEFEKKYWILFGKMFKYIVHVLQQWRNSSSLCSPLNVLTPVGSHSYVWCNCGRPLIMWCWPFQCIPDLLLPFLPLKTCSRRQNFLAVVALRWTFGTSIKQLTATVAWLRTLKMLSFKMWGCNPKCLDQGLLVAHHCFAVLYLKLKVSWVYKMLLITPRLWQKNLHTRLCWC